MMRKRMVALCWPLALAFLATPALACDGLHAAQTAAAGNDAAAAALAAEAAQTDPACTGTNKELANRLAGLAAYNVIATKGEAGAALNGFESDLEDLAKRFGGPWQVYEALAEIHRSAGDYDAAFANYGIALAQLDDTVLTPDYMAPDAAYILDMEQSATEMRLASDSALPMSSRSSGCSFSTRGVEVPRRTVPVRFVFGKTDFTENGLAAARELQTCLTLQSPEAITLIGHTDPVGSREANQALSEKRAEAVAAFLHDNGFAGTIETVGKGEDEPFDVDDPEAYDEDTLFQIFRRVEVEVR